MTAEEQALADDRMRAEIAKLIAETPKLGAETTRMAHDVTKLQAETAKLIAETARISHERFWIPFTIFAGVVIAAISIVPRLFGG